MESADEVDVAVDQPRQQRAVVRRDLDAVRQVRVADGSTPTIDSPSTSTVVGPRKADPSKALAARNACTVPSLARLRQPDHRLRRRGSGGWQRSAYPCRLTRPAIPGVLHARRRDRPRVALPPSRAAAPVGVEADPVRRRRAQLDGEGLGLRTRGRDGPLGADVPRRLRGRAAQPGRADPLRGAQRARLDRRRAHLLGVAGHGGGDARTTSIPQFTVDAPPAGPRLRRLRPELLHRARLHQHAQRARPRRHPAARRGPHRRRPDRARRRPRGVQPRADRRLPRRRRARRRRGGRARDLRGRPRVEGRGPARRPRRAAAAARGQRRRLRAALLRRDVRRRRDHRGRRTQPARASRSGSASTR